MQIQHQDRRKDFFTKTGLKKHVCCFDVPVRERTLSHGFAVAEANSSAFRRCESRDSSKILTLARVPKTVPFLGPHFGGGEPLSSSFLGTEDLDADQKLPSKNAAVKLRNSRLDTACLEHIFASKSQLMCSRVAALTVEGLQALGKNLDNFRTHKSGPVERVSGSHASTFSRAEVFRAQCKIR